LNYYPSPQESIAEIARKSADDPRAVIYDAMMADGGTGFCIYTINNWAHSNRQAIHDMIRSPSTVLGLADAGAHVTAISDASSPTSFLTGWVRDLPGDDPFRIGLPEAIRMLTSDPARLFGLDDRGLLETG